jgi:tRNA A-37 threonylcarbamoyl transferase component Bud32
MPMQPPGVSGFALRVNLIHEKEMDDCVREALDGLRRLYKPRKAAERQIDELRRTERYRHFTLVPSRQ